MQLARAEWGGPAADNLLVLSFVFGQQEQAALEAAVEECVAGLPGPPPTPELDRGAFEQVRHALAQAKAALAEARGRESSCSHAVAVGVPAGTGGPLALLDERDRAQDEARRAKARFDDLVQMEQRAREDLGRRHEEATAASAKALRAELGALMRTLDAKLTQTLLAELPLMLAIRVRLVDLRANL